MRWIIVYLLHREFYIQQSKLILKFIFISLFGICLSFLQSEEWIVPDAAKSLENPTDKEDQDDLEYGQTLFSQHCKSCHGTKGLGDGKKAAELATPVPDITTSEFNSQSDGEMYYKTYIGREDMPSFEKKIKDEEDQWLLINYLKNL